MKTKQLIPESILWVGVIFWFVILSVCVTLEICSR